MGMPNKYDQIRLVGLVKSIQETAIQLTDPALKKKMSTTAYTRTGKELSLMRASATARLKQMDRTLPNFFHPGYLVEYKPYQPPGKDEWESVTETVKEATVVGHEDKYCVIQPKEGGPMLKVDPSTLLIKHMRTTY